MVAKIGRSSNLFGTLSYNNSKMEQDKGEILMTNKMIETADGKYTVSQLAKSFEPYVFANRNTEKHTLHISLNPDPKDQVSDQQYQEIAQQYMDEIGYGNQPFVVFKHTDIDRTHIHIVSVCVNEQGKKISDKFEKMRSMKVCREIEKKFGLICALEKDNVKNSPMFRVVNYKNGNVKSQVASVVRNASSHYQFQSLGEYNALLSTFNIASEKVEGELHGVQQKGLLYFLLDADGKKTGNPFKASLFGKKAGLAEIEKHFESCRIAMNNHSVKEELKKTIESILISAKDEHDFAKKLSNKGIDSVIRKTENGRIYGMTFIDHHSKMVWNGSRLGKDFSANIFNDLWNHNIQQNNRSNIPIKSISSLKIDFLSTEPDSFFNFETIDENIISLFSSLLSNNEVENFEDLDFARRMNKNKIRKRH